MVRITNWLRYELNGIFHIKIYNVKIVSIEIMTTIQNY